MPLTAAAVDTILGRIFATPWGALVQFGLLDGDPRAGGLELTAEDNPGYARVTVTDWAGFWGDPVDGEIQGSKFFFPNATDAWGSSAVFEGIWVNGVLWDFEPIEDDVAAESAGPGPWLLPRRGFNERADLS